MNIQTRLKYRSRKKSRKKALVSELDTASIGDIAFLLLIFFIVTSSFMIKQGIFVTLPKQHASKTRVLPDRILKVTPEKDGFIVNEEKLTEEGFQKILREKVAIKPEMVLIVNMKDNVSYDRLIATYSIAKKEKVRKISLKTFAGDQK